MFNRYVSKHQRLRLDYAEAICTDDDDLYRYLIGYAQ